MRRLLCLMLCVVLMIGLCGCSFNESVVETEGNDNRMTLIYNDGFALIYCDNETGVQYLRVGNGVCVMVNADGTPYTKEK